MVKAKSSSKDIEAKEGVHAMKTTDSANSAGGPTKTCLRRRGVNHGDCVLFPYNLDQKNMHWVLVVYDLSEGTVYLLDSFNMLKKPPVRLSQAMSKAFPGVQWNDKVIKVPPQRDSTSCGVFVLKYMETVLSTARDVPLSSQLFRGITQENVEGYRSDYVKIFLKQQRPKTRELPQQSSSKDTQNRKRKKTTMMMTWIADIVRMFIIVTKNAIADGD